VGKCKEVFVTVYLTPFTALGEGVIFKEIIKNIMGKS
jgi:hypothetical protein